MLLTRDKPRRECHLSKYQCDKLNCPSSLCPLPCCANRSPVLCHERLSIVGVGRSISLLKHPGGWLRRYLESGAQPLTNADDSIILAVNGEIYNHRLIRKALKESYHFKTTSDCEVIIPLVRCYPLWI